MTSGLARLWVLLLGAMAIIVPSCSEQLPSYRYRLTVEIDTPEGLRTGSSILEVRTDEGRAFPGPEAATVQSQVLGEAVAVDLGERGILFALLQSADRQTGASGYAWALLTNPPTAGRDIEGRRENYRALRSTRGPAELPPELYPMLVRFRDISDPATVEQVGPEHMMRHFGSGVRLKRIVVEITDDPVSHVITDTLPWLKEYARERRRLSGRTGPIQTNSVADNLGPGSFKGSY